MAYDKEVTDLYGKVFLDEILKYVVKACLSENQAQLIAFKLGDEVGGHFKKERKQKDFNWDREACKKMFSDYYEIQAPRDRGWERKKIITILEDDDLKLKNLAKILRELNSSIIEKMNKVNEWPKLLIIGKKGTGKSSLCNVLSGKGHNAEFFPTCGGSGATLTCTQETKFEDVNFCGDRYRPLSIIDTIGFDDPSKDHDAEIIAELITTLQNNVDHVNLFLIAVNGHNRRLDGSLLAILTIFQGMFPEKFWDQVAVVFTQIQMNQDQTERREEDGDSDDGMAKKYMALVDKHFGGNGRNLKYRAKNRDESSFFKKQTDDLLVNMDGLPTDMMKKVATNNQKLKQNLDRMATENAQTLARMKSVSMVELGLEKIFSAKGIIEETKKSLGKTLRTLADRIDYLTHNSIIGKAASYGVGVVGTATVITGAALTVTAEGAEVFDREGDKYPTECLLSNEYPANETIMPPLMNGKCEIIADITAANRNSSSTVMSWGEISGWFKEKLVAAEKRMRQEKRKKEAAEEKMRWEMKEDRKQLRQEMMAAEENMRQETKKEEEKRVKELTGFGSKIGDVASILTCILLLMTTMITGSGKMVVWTSIIAILASQVTVSAIKTPSSIVVRQDYELIEFPLSKSTPTQAIVPLPPFMKLFNGGTRAPDENDRCELVLNIEVASTGDGPFQTKQIGETVFTAEHPNLGCGQEKFAIVSDGRNIWREAVLCFTDCKNAVEKSVLLRATTNLTEVKNIRIVPEIRNKTCKIIRNPRSLPTILGLLFMGIFLVATVLLLLKQLLKSPPPMKTLQDHQHQDGNTEKQQMMMNLSSYKIKLINLMNGSI